MRMCPNGRLCARIPRARCRAASPGSQAACAAKAGRSGVAGTPAGVPVPEIVLRVVTVGLGGSDLRPDDAERIGAVAQGWAGHPSVSAAAFTRLLQNGHRLASVKRRHPVLRGDAGVPLPGRRCRSWGGPICRPGERCVRCAGRGCDEGSHLPEAPWRIALWGRAKGAGVDLEPEPAWGRAIALEHWRCPSQADSPPNRANERGLGVFAVMLELCPAPDVPRFPQNFQVRLPRTFRPTSLSCDWKRTITGPW